jgi:hypothetical protein
MLKCEVNYFFPLSEFYSGILVNIPGSYLITEIKRNVGPVSVIFSVPWGLSPPGKIVRILSAYVQYQ